MEKFLTAQQVLDYRKMHKQCKILQNADADRIKAILMLNNGNSFEHIAESLLIDGETVRRWHLIYERSGMKELLTDHYEGSQPKLSMIVQTKLSEYLENHIFLSAKAVCQFVKEKYSVIYTEKGMTELLHRMGFVYKKPKLMPGKANRQLQEKFIEDYENVKQTMDPKDHIYFMDGTHPTHNAQLAYGWIKKGEDAFVQSNTGRERVNINGAYDIQKHKIIVREDESINAQSTIALLKQMSQRQRTGLLYIILDNARYYRSKMVQKFLDKNSRIKFMYLPSYSPNLNIIERLWKWIKKKVSYNMYYEKFSEFKRKIFEYFENIKLYRKELITLMTENFQLFPASRCNVHFGKCVRN